MTATEILALLLVVAGLIGLIAYARRDRFTSGPDVYTAYREPLPRLYL